MYHQKVTKGVSTCIILLFRWILSVQMSCDISSSIPRVYLMLLSNQGKSVGSMMFTLIIDEIHHWQRIVYIEITSDDTIQIKHYQRNDVLKCV
jgi:hypothetical protein